MAKRKPAAPPPPPPGPDVYELASHLEEGEEEEENYGDQGRFDDDPEVDIPEIDIDLFGDTQPRVAGVGAGSFPVSSPKASSDVAHDDYESETYKYKDLKDLKLPGLPKDSAGYRSWRNAVLTQFGSKDRTGTARILKWFQACLKPEANTDTIIALQSDSNQLPRLDAYLASQISEARYMKGGFGLEIQSYIERAHAHGITPSGRAMLAMLSRRFRVDRVRGVTVTQPTLLAVSLDGYSYNQMIAFKEKVEYILNGMPPESWPSDTTLFSWFYGKIKASRGTQRIVDKIKDSAPGSNMRSFSWLWEQFSDYVAELREDQNERDFREAMMKETATAAAKTSAAVALVMPSSASAKACNSSSPSAPEGQLRSGLSAVWRFVTRFLTMFHAVAMPTIAPFAHDAIQSHASAAPAPLSMPAGARTHTSEGNSYEPEWIADCGAGRSLASHEALSAQGIFLDERLCRDDEPIVFETGNGRTTSGSVLYTSGSTFGDSRSYMLPSCPIVRSIGEIVQSRKPFLRLPDRMPMFLEDSGAIQYSLMHQRCMKRTRSKIRFPYSVSAFRSNSPNLQHWVSQRRN